MSTDKPLGSSTGTRSSDKKKAGEKRIRLPEIYKDEQLYEGGFLLSEAERKSIEDSIINVPKAGKPSDNVKVVPRIFEREVTSSRGKTRKVRMYHSERNEVFVFGAKLGSGAFGNAYLVQNITNGEWSVIKELLDPKGTIRYGELALLAEEGFSHLGSEGISETESSAPLTPDSPIHLNSNVFLSKLIHGKNLKEVLLSEKLSFERALALIASLLEAQESLYRKGYVHRDIKPDNTIVDGNECILIDYGLVTKSVERGKGKKTNAMSGTAGYISLETYLREPPNTADDIYALGITAGAILESRCNVNPDDYAGDVIEDLDSSKKLEVRRNYMAKLADTAARQGDYEDSLGNGHVRQGAYNSRYQTDQNMSQEEINLCKILFDMTGQAGERPTLNVALEKIRKVRLAHIEKKVKDLPDDSGYKRVLEELLKIRNGKAMMIPHLVNNLDAFLLRSIDSNEQDRPTLSEIEKYKKSLDQTFQTKQEVVHAIKAHKGQPPSQIVRQKELRKTSKHLTSLKEKFEENFIKKANEGNVRDDPFIKKVIEKYQGKLSSIEREIKKINESGTVDSKTLDNIRKQTQQIDNEITFCRKNFDEIIKTNKAIKILLSQTEAYKNLYDKEGKEKKKGVSLRGYLISADTDAKYNNAVALKRELEEMMKKMTEEQTIISSKEISDLIEKYEERDKRAMGKWSNVKDSKFAKMLNEARIALQSPSSTSPSV